MHHRTTIGTFQKIIENEKEAKDCTGANTPLSQKIKKNTPLNVLVTNGLTPKCISKYMSL